MKPFILIALCCSCLALSSCASVAAYNAKVSSRSDSLAGYTKDGNYGGGFTHTVTYR